MEAIIPLILLIGLGYLSRRFNILKSGDERVLSAYIYYFALPSLFFVNLSQTAFHVQNVKFVAVGILPLVLFLLIYLLIFLVFKISSNTFYLLAVSTTFGSYAFFGIPFVTFTFSEQGEQIATFTASFLAVVGVVISLTLLELYKLDSSSVLKALGIVAKKLAKNPLLLSIFCGVSFSLLEIPMPSAAKETLHMLGTTTSPVAILMLGVFLYGRSYGNLSTALALSTIRIVVLPSIAVIFVSFFSFPPLHSTTLVLMHSMPAAVSLIVLSERYNFYPETIASMILITSLSSLVHLNLWLFVLG